jgi:hypothetical protein
MNRFGVALAAAGALALAPASALGDASSPPNCFGQGAAAALAQTGAGAVGTFASGAAQGFKGPGNGSIGQDGVPVLKATCVR